MFDGVYDWVDGEELLWWIEYVINDGMLWVWVMLVFDGDMLWVEVNSELWMDCVLVMLICFDLVMMVFDDDCCLLCNICEVVVLVE